MIPITDKAYRLFHEGSIALSEIEANGMRIDTAYLKRAIKFTSSKIQTVSDKLKETDVYDNWRRTFGAETNLGSRSQLGKVLFKVMKYECPEYTSTGRYKTDEAVLKTLDIHFVRKYLALEKLKKTRSTYLRGILRETVDGFLHPAFNLHLTLTYRSSSDSPNFQNIPIRNPMMAKLVRRAFIARKNHQLVELDFKGAEVACATCYHHDPVMIKYILSDPGKLHTDMAKKIYILTNKEMNKDIRFSAKGNFVFAEFLGDFYIHTAKYLWEAIDNLKLKNESTGYDLYSHLETHGIYELGDLDFEDEPREGTFEKHIREVEHDFWNKRFKVYNQWRHEWYIDYLEKGYFDTLTGFRIEGIMKRNEVINYPVQGSAFHWLLWSLIRIQKLLKKYNMRTLLVGQIHDSIVADVYKKELQNFLEICNKVITVDLRKHWKWIIVPLFIEAEVAPVGGSWYEKKEVKL